LAALLAACNPHDLPTYTASGGPGTGGSGSVDHLTDGGTSPSADGGLPTEACSGDDDGVGFALNVTVSEVGFPPNGFIEIYNRSTETIYLEELHFGGALSQLKLTPGMLPAKHRIVVGVNLSPNAGEITVAMDNQPQQYLCWGAAPVTEAQNEAVATGFWATSAQCIAAPAAGDSLHLRGVGNNVTDYLEAPPSPLGCSQ